MKKYSRVINANPVMKWLSVTLFGALSLIGCDVQKKDEPLFEKQLREVKIGSTVKLSDLIRNTADSICVLYPYQEKVSDKYHESSSINKYLQDVKYQADEGHWSLVVWNTNTTNIHTFKRSDALDIASHGIKTAAAMNLPANFEMADCASFAQAVFFKTSMNNRIYLIFGASNEL